MELCALHLLNLLNQVIKRWVPLPLLITVSLGCSTMRNDADKPWPTAGNLHADEVAMSKQD